MQVLLRLCGSAVHAQWLKVGCYTSVGCLGAVGLLSAPEPVGGTCEQDSRVINASAGVHEDSAHSAASSVRVAPASQCTQLARLS